MKKKLISVLLACILVLGIGLPVLAAAAWERPTSYDDPSSGWIDEPYAYDDSTITYAKSAALDPAAWSTYLELNIVAIDCDELKFYAYSHGSTTIDLDVYYGAAWHDVYSGSFASQTWTLKNLGGTYSVTAMRMRFKNNDATPHYARVYSALFQHIFVAPTVTTQAVTNIQDTTAWGHGTITDTGDENCTYRGICWNQVGTPTRGGSHSEEYGSFGTGAFSREITGLTGGLHYYVRAYAGNPAGIAYGSEVEFDTIVMNAPTVTTQAVTAILSTTATGNGTVTDTGSASCTKRGIVYDEATHGDPGNTAPAASDYSYYEEESPGPFIAEAFTRSLTGLDPGQTYYVRAYAYNVWGYSYGGQVSFAALIIAPAAATEAASSIATTTARLNSVLTDDGGGLCRSRFGYGTTTQVTIAAYDEQTTWTGYTYSSGQHPYEDIDTLIANTEYFFRVEMQNDAGTTLGSELTFTTLTSIDDPTNLRGYPHSTSISLAWAKGDGSTQSLVRFGYDTYPTLTTEGTQVYLGTSASYTHSGLIVGTTYYYSVWGESGGDYSASYDTVMVTTSAAEAAAEGLPTPTTPARWLAAPDYTNLENLLVLYPAVNGVADYLEMPRETLWMMLALLGAVALGIAVYMVSGGKMLLGMLALIIALVFGWTIKIVPFWIPLMTIILVVGIKITHRETQT